MHQKTKVSINQKPVMTTSLRLDNNQKLKQLSFVPQSNSFISHTDTKIKTSYFRIKKYQSMQTNNSEETALQQKLQKNFIDSYKNDIFYKKKIDYFIKQHQKRMKQCKSKQILSVDAQKIKNGTWKTIKIIQLQQQMSLYQKYKKWIKKIDNLQH